MGTIVLIISIVCVLFLFAYLYFKPRIEYLEESNIYVLYFWWGSQRRIITF